MIHLLADQQNSTATAAIVFNLNHQKKFTWKSNLPLPLLRVAGAWVIIKSRLKHFSLLPAPERPFLLPHPWFASDSISFFPSVLFLSASFPKSTLLIKCRSGCYNKAFVFINIFIRIPTTRMFKFIDKMRIEVQHLKCFFRDIVCIYRHCLGSSRNGVTYRGTEILISASTECCFDQHMYNSTIQNSILHEILGHFLIEDMWL